LKILHLEDDRYLAQYFFALFKKAGFDYGHAVSPSIDPVGLVLREQPDLILSDVVMPVMDGFEAARKFKADERTKEIPLIYLTNQGGQSDVQTGLSLGAAAYLIKSDTKPIDVMNKIKQVLGI
jgi:CheY-like chemotaxis protein